MKKPKSKYAERRAKGLCGSCGKRKAMPGKSECAVEIASAFAYRAAKAAGEKWDLKAFRKTQAYAVAVKSNRVINRPKQ